MKIYPYGIVNPSTISDVADRILDEFFQIVEQLEIKACLAFGLCLGFVRDGGYIEGDNDLDIVVITEHEILAEHLKENGFNEGWSYPLPANNTHFYKDEVLLDIHFRQSEGFYSSFDNIEHNGKTYPVPHPFEEYLSACYTDWKVKMVEQGNGAI